MNTPQMYAPKAEDNPWRVNDMKTAEEWLQIALWYPFSVRSLIELDGRWLEVAICSSRDNAYHVMKSLEHSHPDVYYIVVQKLRKGSEGREKAVLFAPSERRVRQALTAARLES
jgi:hypothetical protein